MKSCLKILVEPFKDDIKYTLCVPFFAVAPTLYLL